MGAWRADGSRVTFTEVMANNGPEAVELDTLPQISGGMLVGQFRSASVKIG